MMKNQIKRGPHIAIQYRCYAYFNEDRFLGKISETFKNFLLCFSLNYRDFSVESKPIISMFQTMKIRLLDFDSLGLLFFPSVL